MKDSLRHQTSHLRPLTAAPPPLNTVEDKSFTSGGAQSSLLEAKEETAALRSGVLGKRQSGEVDREEGAEAKSFIR